MPAHPLPTCGRCRSVILPDSGAGIVTVRRVPGGRQVRWLTCGHCLPTILDVLRRKPELAGIEPTDP